MDSYAFHWLFIQQNLMPDMDACSCNMDFVSIASHTIHCVSALFAEVVIFIKEQALLIDKTSTYIHML